MSSQLRVIRVLASDTTLLTLKLLVSSPFFKLSIRGCQRARPHMLEHTPIVRRL